MASTQFRWPNSNLSAFKILSEYGGGVLHWRYGLDIQATPWNIEVIPYQDPSRNVEFRYHTLNSLSTNTNQYQEGPNPKIVNIYGVAHLGVPLSGIGQSFSKANMIDRTISHKIATDFTIVVAPINNDITANVTWKQNINYMKPFSMNTNGGTWVFRPLAFPWDGENNITPLLEVSSTSEQAFNNLYQGSQNSIDWYNPLNGYNIVLPPVGTRKLYVYQPRVREGANVLSPNTTYVYENSVKTIDYQFVPYILEIYNKKHTTPTINRNGKVLSWAADSNTTDWYEIEHADNPSFNNSTVATVQGLTYTIPNNLYYGTRYWRLRKKRNTTMIDSSSASVRVRVSQPTSSPIRTVTSYNNQHLQTYTCYQASDWSATLSIVANLPAPTGLTLTKIATNQYRATWNASTDATDYQYTTHNGTVLTNVRTINVIVTNPDTYTFSVRAYNEPSGQYSSSTSANIAMNRLSISTPSFSRASATTGNVNFSRPSTPSGSEDITYRWRQRIGSTIIKDWATQSSTTLSIANLKYANNIIELEAIYTDNTNFNSTTTQYGITTSMVPKLSAPVINRTDINSNIPGVGSGATGVTINWASIQYSTSYRVTRVRDGGTPEIYNTTDTHLNFTTADTPGNWVYNVVAYSNEDPDNDFTSANSNTISYDIHTLATPTIGFKAGLNQVTPTWDSISNATHYLMTISNVVSDRVTTGTEQDINNIIGTPTAAQTYNITLKAASTSSYYYRPSSNSNTLVYNTNKLSTPTNIVYDNGELSWDSVANANRYEIYSTDNTLIGTSSTNSFEYAFDLGFNSVYIIAKNVYMDGSTDISLKRNPYYIQSNPSNYYVFGGLNTPAISKVDNKLVWEHIPGAQGYEIYDNDVLLTNPNPSATEYVIRNNRSSTPLSDGTHQFKVRAYFTDNTPQTWYSTYSNIVSITVDKLDAPIVSNILNRAEIYWPAVSNADNYQIFVGSNLIDTIDYNPTSVDPYIVNYNVVGIYPITVRAIADAWLEYPNSNPSNTVTHTVIQLGTPVVNYNSVGSVITWGLISDADEYEIYLNGDLHDTTTSGSYAFTLPGGTYYTEVKAVVASAPDNPLTKYISSNLSNRISFGQMEPFVITISDNIISWDPVSFADYYEIYYDNEVFRTTDETQFELLTDEPRIFNVFVWARNDDEYMDDMLSFSNTISYEVTRLNRPTVTVGSDRILSWTNIPNADYYEIYHDNQYVAQTSGLNYNIVSTIGVGDNEWYIRARANQYRYLDSMYSNTVTWFERADWKYVVVIDGETYEAQLPFVFTSNIDESLDTATLILSPSDRKTPFEPNSNIDFYIYGEDFDNAIAPSPFNMVVDVDTVEEFRLGFVSKWIHRIQLKELTVLLQQRFISGLSVTQDLQYVKKKAQAIFGDIISPDLGGNILWSHNTALNVYPVFDIANFYNRRAISGPSTGLVGSIYERSTLGKNILLPIDSTVPIDNLRVNIIDKNNNNSTKIPIIKRYYYRKYDSNYSTYTYNKTANEVLIASTTDNDIITWRPTSTGKYDIILEMEATQPLKVEDMFPTGQLVGQPQWDNKTAPWNTLMLSEPPRNNWSGYPDYGQSIMKPYRVVWEGVNIVNTGEELLRESPDRITVADVLNKLVNTLEPVSDIADARYEIDPKIINLTKDLDAPEMTFEKGKSLWEALLYIGKSFYGIPRLLKNNVITFDLVKNMITNMEFEDDDTPIDIKSPVSNFSTGTISHVSNMISTDNYMTSPLGSYWSSIKSSDISDPIANRDNASIAVEHPIQRLIDVRIKGHVVGNPNIEVSLQPYIYEKTLFDALNNDKDGKGRALYYEDHGKFIKGLGIIRNTTYWEEVLGLEANEYVIQAILTDMGYQSLTSIKDWRFKVYYVPYLDGIVTQEKANVAGLSVESYRAANQEDNTISDEYFGKNIQNQLERNANNTINQDYRISNISKLPFIGQVKNMDGDKYYADIITYRFDNYLIDINVNYTKNINKIHELMRIDASYRQWEIPTSGYIDREIPVNEYLTITKSSDSKIDAPTGRNMTHMLSAVKSALVDGDPRAHPSALYMKAYDAQGYRLSYRDYDDKNRNITGLAIPLNYSTPGSSIRLSGEMNTNYSAGVYTTVRDFGGDTVPSGLVQRDARYVDEFGKLGQMEFHIIEMDNFSNTITNNEIELPTAKWISNQNTLFGSNMLYRDRIHIDKDARERLRFTYQLHMNTYDKDVYIGPNITKRLFKNKKYDASIDDRPVSKPKWYLYKGSIKERSSLEGMDRVFDIGYPVVNINNTYGWIQLTHEDTFPISNSYDGYALAYPDTKEIIFAYNKQIPAGPLNIQEVWKLKLSTAKLGLKD